MAGRRRPAATGRDTFRRDPAAGHPHTDLQKPGSVPEGPTIHVTTPFVRRRHVRLAHILRRQAHAPGRCFGDCVQRARGGRRIRQDISQRTVRTFPLLYAFPDHDWCHYDNATALSVRPIVQTL